MPPNPWAVLGILLVLLCTAWTYAPSVDYPFVDWDDPHYVRDNEALRALDLEQIVSEFERPVAGNYHPITMLSYALDIRLFGKQPGPMHATNLALHLLNIALGWLLILRLTRSHGVAVLTAAFFAFHPLRVESVAWISARKDLLMFFFSTLSLLAYLQWHARPRVYWLIGSIVAFALALLSKAMAVALVPVLFLIDRWMRGRWDLLWQWPVKLAFGLPAVAIGVVTLFTQEDALQQVHLSFPARFIVGCRNLLVYVQRLTLPVDLSAYYAYPDLFGGTIPDHYYGVAVLLPALLYAWWRIAPPFQLSFGPLFLVLNLLLVLQFLPAGHAMQADRYTYTAGLGWAMFLALLSRQAMERWNSTGRVALGVIVCAALLLFLQASRNRLEVWSDPIRLWDDMIAANPRSPNLLVNRALTHVRSGDDHAALRDLDRAVEEASPLDQAPLQFRARHHLAMGDVLSAERDLLRCPPPWPLDISAPITYWHYSNGDCDKVLQLTTRALDHAPTNSDLLNMEAYCRLHAREFDDAGIALDRSAASGTDYAEYWVLRAALTLGQGRVEQGCEQLTISYSWPVRDPRLARMRQQLHARYDRCASPLEGQP